MPVLRVAPLLNSDSEAPRSSTAGSLRCQAVCPDDIPVHSLLLVAADESRVIRRAKCYCRNYVTRFPAEVICPWPLKLPRVESTFSWERTLLEIDVITSVSLCKFGPLPTHRKLTTTSLDLGWYSEVSVLAAALRPSLERTAAVIL